MKQCLKLWEFLDEIGDPQTELLLLRICMSWSTLGYSLAVSNSKPKKAGLANLPGELQSPQANGQRRLGPSPFGQCTKRSRFDFIPLSKTDQSISLIGDVRSK